MRVSWILFTLWLAAISRCDEPRSSDSKPDPSPTLAPGPGPHPGDFVRIRGILGEDVDCRLLSAEDGVTYSLNVRLGRYANGSRICVHGTLAEVSPCMTSPMIEVQSLKPPSACP